MPPSGRPSCANASTIPTAARHSSSAPPSRFGANGAVELVQILGADGAARDVRHCYSSHLKKWRFPTELLRGEEKLLVNFVL